MAEMRFRRRNCEIAFQANGQTSLRRRERAPGKGSALLWLSLSNRALCLLYKQVSRGTQLPRLLPSQPGGRLLPHHAFLWGGCEANKTMQEVYNAA